LTPQAANKAGMMNKSNYKNIRAARPATWRIGFITAGSYTAARWHYARDKMWNQY